MRKSIYPLAGLSFSAVLLAAACDVLQPDTLGLAGKALGTDALHSLEFSGGGKWYQFGQAPNPGLPWPAFAVKTYTADIDYDQAAARVQIIRSQIVEPDRQRPVPVEQTRDQYLRNGVAWDLNVAADGTSSVRPLPVAVEERAAEIWSTPQGFVKAAQAHNAEVSHGQDGTQVTFTVDGKYRYEGTFDDSHLLTRVQTWIDNPVLGDTLVETRFEDYKDYGGVTFPSRILREQGGFPVLDLTISDVKPNPEVAIAAPEEAQKPAQEVVKADELAPGVYYLTGGTHHSVAIEQTDHVVLLEAPLHESRSNALLAKLAELFPAKPVKYVVNTHAHFDHSGGLRTFVDAGATIITQQANKDYYEKVWGAPHTIQPDKLALSGRPASIEGFTGNRILSDGQRSIELHEIAGNSHNDAFLLAYLPQEKLLVEVDAYTPGNAPVGTSANPYSVNLYENIQKLQLNVEKIAALHGPGLATLDDLRTAIGVAKADEGSGSSS